MVQINQEDIRSGIWQVAFYQLWFLSLQAQGWEQRCQFCGFLPTGAGGRSPGRGEWLGKLLPLLGGVMQEVSKGSDWLACLQTLLFPGEMPG